MPKDAVRFDKDLMEVYSVPKCWMEIRKKIEEKKGIVIVIGGANSGKTVFVKSLGRELSKNGNKVAIIDGDMGQSSFGPPSTFSLVVLPSLSDDLSSIKPFKMYFVGHISPQRHLIPTIIGIKKLLDKSIEAGCEIIIIDTTGFIDGDVAFELKFQKINLINPRHIVGIEKLDEIERILDIFKYKNDLFIHRLPVYKRVQIKSIEQRQTHRRKKFNEYFLNSKIQDINISKIGISGSLSLMKKNIDEIKGLLIGLNDREGFCLGLGTLISFREEADKMRVLTPLSNIEDITNIRIGSIKIDPSGREKFISF
jgi:polynucleotide 5'-hydroxyl-kinase GRC3/NOL9